MFNIILALIAGILIGWNFHAFFISLNPPQILREDFNLSKTIITSPKKHLFKESNSSTKKTLVPITFNSLLNNKHFEKALKKYEQSNEAKKIIYREIIQRFFEKNIYSNAKEASVQLHEYLKIEPQNIQANLQLVEAYKTLKEYDKVLALLRNLLENSNSAIEQEMLNKEIINNSKIYIDELNRTERFQQLIAFLEEQIEYGLNTAFYTFTLAKHYTNTKKAYPIAIKLLKEIEFDEKYGEKAKALLKKIEIIQTEKENYTYHLPLIKEGEHFLIYVTIDEVPLKLFLDTGASYTLIDEEKLSSLTLLENDITLQTPAGEMHSKLQQAQSFKIEELELKEFKLMTTSFKQRTADGLLGMNFFKQFKFKIDQEEGVLYLSSK
jgi:predicted aspartyl protease